MLNTLSEIEDLFDELFPIARSITGDGYRKSVKILSRFIPFEIEKVASGSKVFDWTVPKEWYVRDAYVLDPLDEKIINYKRSNLELVNYSTPINTKMDLNQLKLHLHSIPRHPNWIPYVTSYYKENWGFCLEDTKKKSLINGNYKVVIDSELRDGFVEYGYYYLRAKRNETRKVVMLSSYFCHPSLANNELSGPIILAALFDRISKWKDRKYDYLFLINPETIGSICFLHKHGLELQKSLVGGFVLTCLGGPHQKLSYKKSRKGTSGFDKLFKRLAVEGHSELRNFDPTEGSDERQFCSSGFNMPIGNLVKTAYGSHPEYHTSADNKDFVQLGTFLDTVNKIENILKVHEAMVPLNRKEPYCEIQLGVRGLYPNINSPKTLGDSSDKVLNDSKEQLKAIKYILSYSDTEHDLVDVADLSGISIFTLFKYFDLLIKKNILSLE